MSNNNFNNLVAQIRRAHKQNVSTIEHAGKQYSVDKLLSGRTASLTWCDEHELLSDQFYSEATYNNAAKAVMLGKERASDMVGIKGFWNQLMFRLKSPVTEPVVA